MEAAAALESAYNSAAQRIAAKHDVPLTRHIRLSATLQNDFFISSTHSTIVFSELVPATRLADALTEAVLQAHRVDTARPEVTRHKALDLAIRALRSEPYLELEAAAVLRNLQRELRFTKETA